MTNPPPELPLTPEERATYEWQMWVPDFGEAGQRRLKAASVLISRIGGLGGVVAYELAAAGVGKLILAHAGNIKPSDLNRQLLMTHAALGSSRVESAARRLHDLNPRLELRTRGPEHQRHENAAGLVAAADVVVDCAPMFEERYAMNAAAFAQGKPIVECGMYDMEARITTMVPGETPCLKCLHPEQPDHWKREFPVFGAVSGSLGCLAATEVIKLVARFGRCLKSRLLVYDLRHVRFREIEIHRRPDCPVCCK